MNIVIRVIPRAKKNLVKIEPGRLKVYLTAPPQDGKANELLQEILADHFKVKKRQIKLIRGEKSRDKIIEITE
jgi:uncharacterized protein